MKHIQRILSLSILATCLLISTHAAAEELAAGTGRDHVPSYHVYDDVDLIATVSYQSSQHPKISVKSVYPQLQSDSDSDNEGMTQFNQLVKEIVKQQIDIFNNEVKQTQDLQKNLPPQLRKNNLNIDYNAAAIESSDQHLISIRFSVQGYIGGMAHPSHQYDVLNFNLETGQKIELSDLFKEGADYLTVLSDAARLKLSKHLTDQQMLMEGTSPKLENFKNWNLKPSGLLITFAEAQVAPYVNGEQTVLVPYYQLKNILSTESPLARCIKHKKNCVQNNLLTGGFIDEA